MAARGVIDLLTGHPPAALLDLARPLLRHGAAAWADRGDTLDMSYHPDPGTDFVRKATATFVNAAHAQDGVSGAPVVDASNVFVVPGCSQALAMCAATLTNLGGRSIAHKDVVVLEDPTYFLARQMFVDAGLTPVGVGVDEHGLKVDELEALLEEGAAVRMVYTIPVHHNPLGGVTMTPARREELVALSKKHGFYVIADEVYQHLSLLHEDIAPPPPPMFSFDRDGNGPPTVISVGSASKLLAPAARFGWLLARAELFTEHFMSVGYLVSGGSLASLQANIVAEIMSDGSLLEHRSSVRKSYTDGCDALLRTLDASLPAAPDGLPPLLSYRRPHGGYFAWLHMARGDCDEFTALLKELGVRVLPGRRCSAVEGATSERHNAIRLCFAMREVAELEEAARRIGEAARVFDEKLATGGAAPATK